MSTPPVVAPAAYPQVGRGWAFPPRWGLEGDVVRVAMNQGVEHVAEAMRLVLRTALGSRAMRPGFGSGVERFVFEPPTPDVCHRLADDVRRALLLGEPRVIVDRVEALPRDLAGERVDVTIDYRVDRHRRPSSLVVPFYLAGTT